MIAEVVVDIKNKAVNKVFDYTVPEELAHLIQPGVRVLVPFGPRTIMGFVISLKEQTELQNLRPIKELIDVVPVLNDELRELGMSLSEETGSTMIQCFEAMIPNAMRAKYKKKLLCLSDTLSPNLASLFQNSRVIDYEQIPANLLKEVKQAIEHKQVELIYEVKDQLGKKMIKYIALVDRNLDLSSFNRAAKQKQVLEYLIAQPNPVLKSQLMDELQVTHAIMKTLVDKSVIKEIEVEAYRDPYADVVHQQSKALKLNQEQQVAVTTVAHACEENACDIFLLHGITGSGKTEVYLQMIENVLVKGQQAIMLVPEIALTPQIAGRFKSRFQNKVAVLHSALSMGEKYDEWRKILKQEVQIVVGARSAIFAPFKDIGIIIIDEEHEATYKQEEAPRYHAIEVAKQRAITHRCPVVLGSATPSLESFARAQKGVYRLLTLSKRAVSTAKLPTVKLIDMRQHSTVSDQMILSDVLQEAIAKRLERQEQVVLLLNRRGYSNFMQCRECGEVVNCPNCDVSLTYHKPNQKLKCHYCGFESFILRRCPSCQSEELRFFGLGTQKVEEYLQDQFRGARIMRMDVDTTSKKGSHQELIAAFERKEADILIGTQMVGKGLDFPDVTLVGVLAADLMLHLSDFKAAERTFQLLTQVAGRAGRHELEGEVLIQTYSPEHYVMKCVVEQNYHAFYVEEMKMRRRFGYPPYYYLASVMISSEEYNDLIMACDKVNQYLRNQLGHSCIIVGPTMPYVGRINQRFRMYFMIKYKQEPRLRAILSQLLMYFQEGSVSLSLDFFPNQFN
ncbi:primosomal protein N' [Turicibacter sp. H121]|uniref:primosomal protein N' n=1 Tax=Turicibacter sp. H121 TaxID=1712675 RepID=UPI0009E8E4EC|nr:primosomal protein N' [Turicibacter sp. H121]MCU7199100.1 primosomal protein N' [Turicibacter sp. H121]